MTTHELGIKAAQQRNVPGHLKQAYARGFARAMEKRAQAATSAPAAEVSEPDWLDTPPDSKRPFDLGESERLGRVVTSGGGRDPATTAALKPHRLYGPWPDRRGQAKSLGHFQKEPGLDERLRIQRLRALGSYDSGRSRYTPRRTEEMLRRERLGDQIPWIRELIRTGQIQAKANTRRQVTDTQLG